MGKSFGSFEGAGSDLPKIELPWGESKTIREAADFMIRKAQEQGKGVAAEFNGVIIQVYPESLPDEIERQYLNKRSQLESEYAHSSEARALALQKEQERIKIGEKLDALIDKISSLDLANDAQVFEWISEFDNLIDSGASTAKMERVVQAFMENERYRSAINVVKRGEQHALHDLAGLVVARVILARALPHDFEPLQKTSGRKQLH